MNLRNKFIVLPAAMLVSIAAGVYSCKKPFEGVSAIVSNDYVAHTISVQITDANASASPYPNNMVLTLSGDAVTRGLIYTSGGSPVTNARGNVQAQLGGLSLAVKPFTTISATQPLRFSILAEAPGYLSATKEVVVTSKDSLQYVAINLVGIATAPTGVSITQTAVSGVANGTLPTATTVNVTSGSGTSQQTVAAIAIPANTTFRDAAGAPITTTGSLSVTAANFSSSEPAATSAVPGGTSNVQDTEGKERTFVMGGAVNINAFLGTTPVKSFSQPLRVDVDINPATINPATGTAVKAGDVIDVWSIDEGSTVWKKEGTATLFTSGGKLKATMNVTHLSTWLAGYGQEVCANPLRVTFTTDAEGSSVHFIGLFVQGTNQLITSGKFKLENGTVLDLKIPAGISTTLRLYEGASANSAVLQSVNLSACATTASIARTLPTGRPILKIDLATRCQNGTFLYSGPIEYKSDDMNAFQPFTPAENGKVTTSLLDWNKGYRFRIIYKGQIYERGRFVQQSEFRQVGNSRVWEFWGKDGANPQTFFNAPIVCD